MPTERPEEPLSPAHTQHYHDYYKESGIPVDEFITQVCEEGMILPQKNIGNQWHMPCCWLGDSDTSIYSVDSAEGMEEVRRRFGWKRLPYLLVLPYPTSADINAKKALSPHSRAGRFLREQLVKAGIDLKDVIATYVSRFGLPRTVRQYSEAHKRACLPYLQCDVDIINPRVIIACGADSLKALYGRKAKLDTYRGNILDYKGTPVIPTISHLAFLGSHANLSVFQQELVKARRVKEKLFTVDEGEKDYRVCTSVADVVQLCEDIHADNPDIIAFDTEYGNDVAREEYRYTLSVQLSWGKGKAAFVQLRKQVPQDPYWDVYFIGREKKDGTRTTRCRRVDPGPRCGVPMHTPEDERKIWRLMQALLLNKKWKLAAHHLRVDAEEFARAGYPIDERIEDGIDTMLIHHLLYGDESQGLDHLVHKYMPESDGYWMDLEEWLDDNERNRRLEYGYRDIPLDILIPYAQKDADVTWSLAGILLEELKKEPELDWLYWNHTAPTSLHLLDVERQGILIDEDRRTELHDIYQPVYDELLAKLRKSANWPSFNPSSSDDKAALLFSTTQYRKKKDAPEGARVYDIKPLMNTDKYPKDWTEIEAAGEEVMNAPSTKAGVLDLLAHKHPEINELRWLKHLSVIGTFLKNYLKPQTLNDYGVPKDGKGFHNNIGNDGRVRTHLSQLTQTGRYTSNKANLQTRPKRQEAAAFEALVEHYFGITVSEYEKRIDPDYTGADAIAPEDALNVPKFASCFIAPPGYALIEADFATAELRVWGFLSRDQRLIDVVTKRDLHSEVASESFNLYPREYVQELVDKLEAGDRKPYKAWCEELKKKHGSLRVAAKTVNFGIMYGRSARALAFEINKVVDTPVTQEDTQKIIDSVARRFPVAWKWLNDNAASAVTNEFIKNAFGRRRYFQGASQLPSIDQAAVKREAKNSPIQGTVADLLAQAGVQLYRFLRKTTVGKSIDMEILLPIHDAFLFCVKNEDVAKACKVIDLCMASGNKIVGTEYYLDVDIEIMPHRWSDKGEKDPRKFMESIGLAA